LESTRRNTNTPIVTTDFVYVRLIGDRSIQERDFGRIQIDRIAEMQKWADNIKNLQGDVRIKHAIIAANNHYAGFGPGVLMANDMTIKQFADYAIVKGS
jgi:uncharacterized protein YecE (DUF72 family)